VNLDLLKGLLIILVVADHNEFSRSLFPGFLHGMTFHVLGFMAIPFLKPPPREFAAYAFRLYYPFMLVTVALALVTWVSAQPDPARLALALYSGNAMLLKSVAQMGLLWFLPSFIAIVALWTLARRSGRAGSALVLAAALLAHPFIGTVAMQVQDAAPLGLLPALYMYPLCILVALTHRRLLAEIAPARALLATLAAFAAVKALQMAMGLHNEVGFSDVADYRRPLALLVNDLEGVCGTLMLFQAARFNFPRLVQQVGQFSMQVYLFHAFVALALYKLAMLAAPSAGALPLFAATMAGTVLLTLLVAKLAVGQPLAKRMVFPKGPGELLGATGHRGR
jgi:fucose 4-O-acetylase-like acetyltransferase